MAGRIGAEVEARIWGGGATVRRLGLANRRDQVGRRGPCAIHSTRLPTQWAGKAKSRVGASSSPSCQGALSQCARLLTAGSIFNFPEPRNTPVNSRRE